ncbi:hypothetical protein F1B92_07860 [Campylobacter sp. FMV-PI01]|uniref:Uncharacterized protein n=1 Tax=Campylobacter portucalensis TaxID=2608384 RepID=A0A6L5WJ64_9BACT|nr:hypothetical protein [Campylobacter portucalensis]MSN97074.1 hypothetical protein [Campylobacter portucalensis]
MDDLNKLEQETLKKLREKDVDIDDLDDIEGYNKEQKQLIENYKAIRNGLNDTRMDFFAEKTKLIAKNTLNSGGTIYFALDGLATDSTRYNKEKTKIDFEKLDELFDHNNKFYNSVTSKEMRYLYDNFKDHPNIKFTIKDQVIENPFKTINSKKMVD